MVARVREYIREYRMIQPKDKIIVGISGGPDSVCLLFVLTELKAELDFELLCVHVNHGLRGTESDRDESFVRQLCREKGVPCICYPFDVKREACEKKLTLEEAGRECRYRAFREALEAYGGTKIAVAHHANDQAETMLFHLFRGTGIRGLSGMDPIRGQVIRPLLCVERREIEDWLRERGISFCTDSTNREEIYSRNILRRRVIPCAEREINERAVLHMTETAAELKEIEEYLERQTGSAMQLCVQWDPEGCMVQKELFGKLDPVISGRLLRTCMKRLGKGLKDVERVHIRLLGELFQKQAGRRLDLPGGLWALRVYEGIYICRKRKIPPPPVEEGEICPEIPGFVRIREQEWIFSLEKTEKYKLIQEKTYTKWFDYDKIEQSLKIRRRKPGDYLEINREHGRKKLKAYLIDKKIPAKERDELLLLADGSHILWIPGLRISEKYKVTEYTKRILKVRIRGGEEDDGEDQSDDS